MKTPLRLCFVHGVDHLPEHHEKLAFIDGEADMPVPLREDDWFHDGTRYRVMSRIFSYERLNVAGMQGLLLPVITFYVLTHPWWEDPKSLKE